MYACIERLRGSGGMYIDWAHFHPSSLQNHLLITPHRFFFFFFLFSTMSIKSELAESLVEYVC